VRGVPEVAEVFVPGVLVLFVEVTLLGQLADVLPLVDHLVGLVQFDRLVEVRLVGLDLLLQLHPLRGVEACRAEQPLGLQLEDDVVFGVQLLVQNQVYELDEGVIE